MPFITEELWHDEIFGTRAESDCCIIAQLPTFGEINTQLLADVEIVQQIVSQVSNIRNSKQISPKEKLQLSVKANSNFPYKKYEPIITKRSNIGVFDAVTDKISGAASFMVINDEFFIPLNEALNPGVECEKLKKEKEYLIGFLKSVNSKLTNERFMSNAKPEIIEIELKKKADAAAKLKIIEENLMDLAC